MNLSARKRDTIKEIRGGMFANRITVSDLSKRTGISQATLYRRFNDIGTMTLNELWMIEGVINNVKD